MLRKTFSDSPFEAQLEVVSTLADRALEASRAELARIDELTLALRGSLKNGVTVDELSEATGLTPEEIKRRVDRELNVLDDVEVLAGMR
jgi:hypothetical protein